MSAIELERTGGYAYREALPDDAAAGPPVVCLHGFPESSYMYRDLLPTVAEAGHRALALDFPGSGDSPADPPNTWERLVGHVEAFVTALELEPVVLVVHDWGGLIGLRWSVDHPEHVAGLVISDTGFFSDGNWHGMAAGLRTPGTGEQMLEAITRENLGQLMASLSPGFTEDAVDEYFRSIGSPEGRGAILEMYRSGDFEKLAPYEGALGRLGVPTLILWGENDEFAPIGGAHRLNNEIPGSQLEIVAGAGHFVHADAPARCSAAITGFLANL